MENTGSQSKIIPGFSYRSVWLISIILVHNLIVCATPIDNLPNIIIILADDLGYGDIGGYYGGNARTPNLNRLAQEGMLFTDFHSNGAMCSPTRASLLTGRYPQRLGVETAQRNVLDLVRNKDEITIARYLSDAGYYTGIIGKWHLGRPPEGNPMNYGFDKFIGYCGGCIDYFSRIDRWGKKDWWYNEDLLDEEGYVTDLITKHSNQFIRENTDKPFFLYVSHLAVHFPWQGPEDSMLWRRREGEDHTSSTYGLHCKLGPHKADDIPDVLNQMIEQLDESVGSIITTLRECELDNNTLVFFTSDNGQYSDYGSLWPRVGSNGPLRGQKREVWEGGHRVPAIVWWPGYIPALSVSDVTVMTMDILPTVLDMLKIDLPPDNSSNFIDGTSILPLILKHEETLKSRDLFWRIKNKKAVRSGPWKLVINGESENLYNLNENISETVDLFSAYPLIAENLKKKLADWEKMVDQ